MTVAPHHVGTSVKLSALIRQLSGALLQYGDVQVSVAAIDPEEGTRLPFMPDVQFDDASRTLFLDYKP